MNLTKTARKSSVVLSVRCPKCGVPGGKPCVKASGQQAEVPTQRIDRYNSTQAS